MRKLFALALIPMLILASGCNNNKEQEKITPQEMTTLYKNAIEGSRSAEENEYLPVVTSSEDEMADFTFQALSIKPEDTQAYAISLTMMNISVYGVAVITPAEGKEQAILESVEAYVKNQEDIFKEYLPQGYEIAKNAIIKTREDGTVVLVMCDKQDEVYSKLEAALNA